MPKSSTFTKFGEGAVSAEKDVARLQIAMNHAGVMGGLKRCAHLVRDRQSNIWLKDVGAAQKCARSSSRYSITRNGIPSAVSS